MMESLHSSHVDVALTLEDHMFCSVLMEGGIIIPQSVHQSLKFVASCVASSDILAVFLKISCILYLIRAPCIGILLIDLDTPCILNITCIILNYNNQVFSSRNIT